MSRSSVLSSDNPGPMTAWGRSALLARSACVDRGGDFGLAGRRALCAHACPGPNGPTPTPRSTVRATTTVTPTLLPTATPEAPLTGTIIANRTQVSVTFFVDGRTYETAPLRSLSIPVRRDNTVLNLYNCEAKTGADNTACFWDPYLVRQDGFYEVIDQAATGAPVSLLLRDATAPPGDQIWLHNRTGRETAIHYAGATYRLSPGSTVEVALVTGDTAVYVQHCLELAGASVCEWLPVDVVGGVYYGINRVVEAGEAAQSRQISTDLAPVLAQDATLLVASNGPVSAPPTVGCSLGRPHPECAGRAGRRLCGLGKAAPRRFGRGSGPHHRAQRGEQLVGRGQRRGQGRLDFRQHHLCHLCRDDWGSARGRGGGWHPGPHPHPPG